MNSSEFDLSFQDKYILSFERNDFAFNSHLVIEFDGEVLIDKIKSTLVFYFEKEEYLRIVPDEKCGKFHLQKFEENKVINAIQKIDSEVEFRHRPFDFNLEYGIRIGVMANKIIFSFHHSLYDGHAQFVFLKDFFDIYHDPNNFSPRNPNEYYKFRKYFIGTNVIWYLSFFIEILKNKLLPRKRKTRKKIARFFDCEPTDRILEYKILKVDRKKIDLGARKNALSSSAYLAKQSAKALNDVLKMREDSESPFVLYIPKSMRFEFKALRNFQNLLGFIWMKIERDDFKKTTFDEDFRNTYKFRSAEEEVKKTIFLAGVFVHLLSFARLQKLTLNKEKRIHDCTLLISSGRTPQDILFPEKWNITALYPVGAMTRSPGIGILSASFGDFDFITIEYLKSAFKAETIEQFSKALIHYL